MPGCVHLITVLKKHCITLIIEPYQTHKYVANGLCLSPFPLQLFIFLSSSEQIFWTIISISHMSSNLQNQEGPKEVSWMTAFVREVFSLSTSSFEDFEFLRSDNLLMLLK